jgi:hypothetical protein
MPNTDDTLTPNHAPPPRQSIFRAQALRHYRENQEKVVLPNLVSPRSFVLLWVIATLVMIAGLVLAFWPWRDQLLAGVL